MHINSMDIDINSITRTLGFGITMVFSSHSHAVLTTIRSHFTLMPSEGNATVKLEIIPPGKKKGTKITRDFAYVSITRELGSITLDQRRCY